MEPIDHDEDDDQDEDFGEEDYPPLPEGIGGGENRGGSNIPSHGFTPEEFVEVVRMARRFPPEAGWDDEFVLKVLILIKLFCFYKFQNCQTFFFQRRFSALLPAFDPRPGRTNVPQTQDVELPIENGEIVNQQESNPDSRPAVVAQQSTVKTPELKLIVRGPNMENISDISVKMIDEKKPIFGYIQEIMLKCELGGSLMNRVEKSRRVWEPIYSISYEQKNENEEKNEDEDEKLLSRCPSYLLTPSKIGGCSANDLLKLLKVLYEFSSNDSLANNFNQNFIDFSPEEFISTKINQKMLQQLMDPLVVSSQSLPVWCDFLISKYPMLFPFSTREFYFNATAFGTSRAIVWLQNQRDQAIEEVRSNVGSARRSDQLSEFRVGRIKHERIRVPRGPALFQFAQKVMNFHARRRAVLEIEFQGEEGTGLGPTLVNFSFLLYARVYQFYLR